MGAVILLGLSGPAGSGKSTAGEILVSEHGFTAMAFADPIRAAVRGLFAHWGDEYFDHPRKERVCPVYGVSPRATMRAFGEHARSLNALIYVHHMVGRVAEQINAGNRRLVITDVRLPEEAIWLRTVPGGRVVHVRRPGVAWAHDHVTERGPGRGREDLDLVNGAGFPSYAAAIGDLIRGIESGTEELS